MGAMVDPNTDEVFTVLERADWKARPAKARNSLRDMSDGIFAHHTVSRSGGDIAQIVRETQNFHMDGRGWLDIAYSWLISQSGLIIEGRGWGIAGGHTDGYNDTSIAICFVGNFENETPTPAALRAFKCVQANAEAKHGKLRLRGHRDAAQTACPGANVYAWVKAGAPYPPGSPTPTATKPPEKDDDTMPAAHFVLSDGSHFACDGVSATWLRDSVVDALVWNPFPDDEKPAIGKPRSLNPKDSASFLLTYFGIDSANEYRKNNGTT